MKTRTVLIGTATLAIAGALGWRYGPGLMSPSPPAVHAAPAIPVTAGIAEAQDIPVYIQGLGTVQAFNTVNVRSRVDGQITKVFFKEGQEVKTGDPLFQIDPRPFQAALDQAKATKAKDQASLQGAQLDLQRYSKLMPSGFQTQQQYDQQKATVGQFQGAVQADQAQIDTAQLNLDYATVRSPIDGRTGQRLVDIGNYVQATQNTNLVTVTQLKPIYVSFTLPQTELDPVRQADAERRACGGCLRTGQQDVAVARQADLDRQSGRCRDRHVPPAGDVRQQRSAAVAGRVRQCPSGALDQEERGDCSGRNRDAGAEGAYVYVIEPDDTADRRAVTVAMTQEGRAIIDKGLSAGDHVVVEGQYRVTQGGKLQIRGGPGSNNVAEGSTQTTSQNAGSGREPTQ